MDNLDDLKAIWHTAKTDSLPSSNEMLRLIRKFRNQKLRSKWLSIITSLLISILITTVLFIVHFKLISTYIGGTLMVVSGLLLAASNIRSLKRFYQLEDCSNLEFLAFIEQTRKNQIRYYNRTMIWIVIICSIGWVLYLYEITYQNPLVCFAVYSVIVIYLAVMWFIVRPRSFKRDAEKLNSMQQRLEKILRQLK